MPQCYRGDHVVQPGVVYQADCETPEDITGWTIEVTLRRFRTDPTPFLNVPGTVTDGITGAYEFEFSSEDMTIDKRSYALNVERMDLGSERTLLRDVWTVL